jgi:hypothetical protein
MQSESLPELLGVQPAGLADHREQPSSTALSSVVEPQNASPSGMIASRHRPCMLDGCRLSG